MNEEKVEVGMGATMIGYSDCKPCTIVKVISPTKIVVKICVHELDPTWEPEMEIGGFAAHCTNNHTQRWLIKENEFICDNEFIYTKRKNGTWIRKGQKMRGGEQLTVGIRKKFHDYNF